MDHRRLLGNEIETPPALLRFRADLELGREMVPPGSEGSPELYRDVAAETPGVGRRNPSAVRCVINRFTTVRKPVRCHPRRRVRDILDRKVHNQPDRLAAPRLR